MNNLSRYSFVQYIIKLAYSQINNFYITNLHSYVVNYKAM